MKSKAKVFKIGKDFVDGNYTDYVISPKSSEDGTFYVSNVGIDFCGVKFEKLTGIKLKPGEIGKFKLVRVK